MKYQLVKEIKPLDKIVNLFTLKKDEKIKAYCGNCGNQVFRLETRWAEEGLCVFCYNIRHEDEK